MTRRYTYLGDRLTDPALRGRACEAVLRADGRCVSGRSAMLVRFDGEEASRVVLRRLLRRVAGRVPAPDAPPAAAASPASGNAA